MYRQKLKKAKRIVVKVGASVLTKKDLMLDINWMRAFVKQIVTLIKQDIEVVVVSSGAIASGMGILGIKKRPANLPEKQACAALGQVNLMKIYDDLFRKSSLHAGQMLLTWEDVRNRQRYLNAENTLHTLLKKKAVPIINENDTVAIDEIKFGDNDKLSALVANMIGADLLIMLTDVEGLYLGKGCKKCIDVVENIDSKVEALALGTDKECSAGGMKTKLDAVKMSVVSGIDCVIADGREKSVLLKILRGGKIGTLFVSNKGKLEAKKRWIVHNAKVSGRLFVDEGAKNAIISGNKSLLPCGVKKLEGAFTYGDIVDIFDASGNIFAKGLSNYTSDDLNMIKGLNSKDAEKAVKESFYEEAVHRDNLVVL